MAWLGPAQNLFASSGAIATGIIDDGTMPTAVFLMGFFGVVTLLTFLLRNSILRGEPLHTATDKPETVRCS